MASFLMARGLAPAALLSLALLTGCAPDDGAAPTPTPAPAPAPEEEPTDPAVEPLGEPEPGPNIKVSNRTLAQWGYEWANLDKTLDRNVDPKVPVNGLCLALEGKDRAWFGLSGVAGDGSSGQVVFGVQKNPDQAYDCTPEEAAVVVDLATREVVKGPKLFEEIEDSAPEA